MKNIKDNVKNYIKKIGKKRVLSLLVICVLILGLLGGTFAYWNWQTSEAQKTEVAFTLESDFSCAADVGGSIEPGNVPLAPTTCTDTKHAIKRQLIVKPTIFGNVGVYMDLWLDVNSLASELSASQNFRYALTTSDTSCTEGLVSEGTFNGLTTGDKVQMISQKNYSQTLEDTYYLYIWLDAAETNLDTAGKSFNFTINGECGNGLSEHTVTFDANGGILDSEGTLITKVGETQYIVPKTGDYKLEVWGAQGGDSGSYIGGYGGYSVGTVSLEKDTILYVNVGGKAGTDGQGGINGGGSTSGLNGSRGGGGATHIATVSGKLSSLSSYKGALHTDNSTYDSSEILIVAGGGGGAYYGGNNTESHGGHAGGYRGAAGEILFYGSWGGSGGSQTSGGCAYDEDNSVCTDYGWGGFGAGGSPSGNYGSAGGGGWYGGGASAGLNVQTSQGYSPGGGGSGYIGSSLLTEKAMYCYGCSTSTVEHTLTNLALDVSDDPIAKYAKKGNGAVRISSFEVWQNEYEFGSVYGTLPTPTREDYRFIGWNTEPDGSGTMITGDSVVNLNSDVTLYAIWESAIVYLYNNGTWNTSFAGNITFKGNEDCSLSKNTSSFKLNVWNGDWGTEAVSAVAYWSTPIDLTNYETLVFEGSFSRGSGNPWNGIGIWSSTTSPSWTNTAKSSTTLTNGRSTINVSDLEGLYYIGVWGYYSGTSVTCKSMRLEEKY